MTEKAPLIGFQIQEIRVNSFAIHDDQVRDGDEIGFGINIQHLFESEREEQIVSLQLKAVREHDNSILATLNMNCHYALTGYQAWLDEQPDEHQIHGQLPVGLALTLNSISVSTMRGILFERLRGTTLQGFVLPIIDPSAFQPAA